MQRILRLRPMKILREWSPLPYRLCGANLQWSKILIATARSKKNGKIITCNFLRDTKSRIPYVGNESVLPHFVLSIIWIGQSIILTISTRKENNLLLVKVYTNKSNKKWRSLKSIILAMDLQENWVSLTQAYWNNINKNVIILRTCIVLVPLTYPELRTLPRSSRISMERYFWRPPHTPPTPGPPSEIRNRSETSHSLLHILTQLVSAREPRKLNQLISLSIATTRVYNTSQSFELHRTIAKVRDRFIAIRFWLFSIYFYDIGL